MKQLFGGSDSSGSSSSKNGYSALSPALKKAFDPMGQAVAQFTNPNNPGVTAAFTPTPLSGAENNAVSNINQGFSPTADSLKSDINMQMNPYMDSVINEVNRQGQGQYSVMKQAMDSAGVSGSNRSILGANDIDLSRQNQIGGLLGNQFNTAMNNAMTVLPQTRAADATNQLNVGDMIRKLTMQTNLAPVQALQTGTNMIAPFTAGGTSTSNNSSNTQGGIIPGFFGSDARLKENIIPKGQENGHNVYEFNYRGEHIKYIGVMADEVQETHPEAVKEINGFLAVNYPLIGVNFREA